MDNTNLPTATSVSIPPTRFSSRIMVAASLATHCLYCMYCFFLSQNIVVRCWFFFFDLTTLRSTKSSVQIYGDLFYYCFWCCMNTKSKKLPFNRDVSKTLAFFSDIASTCVFGVYFTLFREINS